ncbi:hypothetical protein BGZ68_006608 [Mortierella alpina]|nr:hypothetical protein BGZ68_006608 [Mortierella alpina]
MNSALASLPSLHAYLEARRGMGHDPDSITLALDETVEMLNVLHRRPTTKKLVAMIKTVKAKASHVLTSQQQAAIRHSTFDNLSLSVPQMYSCTLEDCLYSFIHLDMISDFNCRKCTLVKACKDLEQMIQQAKEGIRAKEDRDRRKKQQLQEEQAREPAEDQASSVNGNGLKESSQKIQQPVKDSQKPRRRSDGNNVGVSSKRLSLAELSGLKDRIDYCLQTDIEMDLTPIELTPVRSRRTTKHSMIAKPPQTLCLHLNRSMITPTGQMSKNSCRVQFHSRLDFTPFTTSGHLTTVATKSMSTRRGSAAVASLSGSGFAGTSGMGSLGNGVAGTSALFARRGSLGDSITPSPSWSNPGILSVHSTGVGATDSPLHTNGQSSSHTGSMISEEADDDRVWYRLCAVLVHLGSHNSGHFVTYRRIPPAAPSSPSPSGSSLPKSKRAQEQDDTDKDLWWRISDEDVQIVEWTLVRAAEAYMLFYEKEC